MDGIYLCTYKSSNPGQEKEFSRRLLRPREECRCGCGGLIFYNARSFRPEEYVKLVEKEDRDGRL